jgi:lipopolysaccharide biosynthesis glycosyltransferase
MEFNKSIVTACDSNYIWGAYLLLASLAYNNVKSYKKVLGIMLSEEEEELLNQFPHTQVINSDRETDKSVCLMKPHAIFSADTDIIAWMDSDCIVTGDVTDFLDVQANEIQIRFRSFEENAGVYRNFYGKDDERGLIPDKVLKTWQEDVGDLKSSQISTVCETNCFVIHKSNFDFIKLWQTQMEKVIIDNNLQVYDKSSVGYFMTDESVLNSIMAYSSKSLNVKEYLFDKDKERLLVHFGLNPKPWIHWTKRALLHYDLVLEIVEWAKSQGYKTPPIPTSFLRTNKAKETLIANLRNYFNTSKYRVSTTLHKYHSKVRS